MSPQNLGSQLGKEDIKTGLLEEISKATGIPMSVFFIGPHGAIDFTPKPVEAEAPDTVPLLPIFAQAGSLTGWSEGIEEAKCERVISPVKDIDMAVHIYGESMYPDIPNGSVVYVRRVTGMFTKLSSSWARHTWATLCAELDVPDPTITLGMGHKTAGHKTTAIYIKRDMKKVDEANRLVIDYVTKTVPHLTAQDGTRN